MGAVEGTAQVTSCDAASAYIAALVISCRVVEDHADSVAAARADPADSVSEIHPVGASRTLRRPVMNGEHHGVALAERHDHRARLHARTLLGDHEFAAGELAAWLGEQDGDLERKHVFAIEVDRKSTRL